MLLYDSMSRSLKEFRPREDGIVRVFTCGPSVYRKPHIGNFRTFCYEDLLVRYLTFLGYKVNRIINFTDIEDKSIEEAANLGKNVLDLTQEIANVFIEQAGYLKLLLPREIPRSSSTIESAVELIKILLEKGYAYKHKDGIFFSPGKVKDFGKLFRLDMSKWPTKTVRFKRDTYEGTRWNLGDFILWHNYKEGDLISWDTEIGKGRPSWNIQDPAIISEFLGNEIDINCGGIDNIYRHHDYNIAIMESISGTTFANYYLHGQHLIVGGKKMSKSLNNIIYVDDLLEKGYKSEHIRFFLLYTHYRKKLNFTGERFNNTVKKLDTFKEVVSELTCREMHEGINDEKVAQEISKLEGVFKNSMNNDLDFKTAFDDIFNILLEIRNHNEGKGLSSYLCSDLKSKLNAINEVMCIL